MIVPMKKALIVFMKDDYEKVLKSLQVHSLIMVINHEDSERKQSLELNENLKQKVEKAIQNTKKLVPKKPAFSDYQTIDYSDFAVVKEETIKDIERVEEVTNEITLLKNQIQELKEKIKTLEPWKSLSMRIEDIHNTKYAKMNMGFIPKSKLEKFIEYCTTNELLCEIPLDNTSNIPVVFGYYYEDEEIVLNDIKSLGFNEVTIKDVKGKVSDYIESLEMKISEIDNNVTALFQELKDLSLKIDDYKVLSDQIFTQETLDSITYQNTDETSIIEGWVRSDQLEEVEKAIQDVTEYYDVEFVDPTDDETPPTYCKNNHVVSQFETITDMFSKPSSKESDPNPVMSVWYWLLFGMMMGDAGYGLIMILVCLAMKKFMRPKGNTLKLINVIMYSGVPTILWGIVFGSYFGFNPAVDWGWNWVWYWFSPMEEPILMLILSIAVGALHLITGLVQKGLDNIKAKNIPALLSKSVSWILIMSGIGMYFINSTIGIVMALIGVALILLFNGAAQKNVVGKAAFGLLGLYDATSYLGDLLSYSRVMALAMSSAAVAMVMNTLAQMVGGSIIGMFFAALIFIGGHAFNLVLGLLSAYVHDSRLQYIEYFGKFYEGGGIDFKPLSLQTKYIKEIKL